MSIKTQQATQLVQSKIPNAFAIKNTNGNDVFMSLQNNTNQLDIRLNDNDFIFKANNENTKLIYSNIDFDVDDIRTNTIANKDHSNIIFNTNVDFYGYIKHYNNNILVLNDSNKIPNTYINDLDYLTIQNTQSNIYIPNSLVNINTCNLLNDSAITIKNNATNTEEITVKLVDNYDRGTIKIYSQDPYVGIGNNIPIKTNNIQLYVESNIKCNDIIVYNYSFIDFYNDFEDYKSNNDITGINKINDILYYSNLKITLETDIENLRSIDNFNFIGNNFVNITNIFCSTNNTYIIADNTLYKLLSDNHYQYIENDIETIKMENDVLIYTKLNKVYFIYNDNTIITENYKIGGYYNNYRYLANNTTIIKKIDNENTIPVKNTIQNIKDIYVFGIDNGIDQFYYIDTNNDLYDHNDTFINSNINSFYLGYNNTYFTDSNLSISSKTLNYYRLNDNNLYDQNDNLIESNVLKVHHSNRHIVILKDDLKLYTKSFDDNYNGLGRSNLSIIDNTLDQFVGLGIPTTDNIIIKPSVNIGSSLDTFKNTIPNSLCVENCISIACKPINDFALRLKGDILIEGGGNIYRSEDKSTIFETNIKTLTLDDYVKYQDFDIRLDSITNDIQNVVLSNLDINTSNINKLLYDTENAINIWSRENNIVLIRDTRVSINPSDNDDYSVLGGNKQPALFVGNHSSNIRGLISEDDIAAYSDESLKTDIYPIENSLNKVLKLNGVNYRRKDNLDKLCMGVIAQNIEKYCPEVVQEHNNIKTVAYANLVALLIEAVKELYHIIKDGKE